MVESRTIGLAQHNPYTWLVRDDGFLIADDIRSGRKFMDKALNQWILSLSQEEMHTLWIHCIRCCLLPRRIT